VTPGTHVICGSVSDNGSDKEQEEIVNVGLGGCPISFLLHEKHFVMYTGPSSTLLNWML
jgi:hypothetical protein